MPAPRPMTRKTTAPPMVSETVVGKRSRMVSQTGSWLAKE